MISVMSQVYSFVFLTTCILNFAAQVHMALLGDEKKKKKKTVLQA